ncbi:MAG TPA: metallophosphoesterase, partial [Rhodospirillales bacterium]|nr:metallophosphoesterase [Rhodospirillales bacterium]
LVSDLHYALKQFDWTAEVAEDFDVVVIAGDHIDISGHVDGRAQIVVILNYLRRLRGRVRLVVSSGNHDLDGRDAAGEKVARWIGKVRALGVPTDGDALDIDGTLFTICPWWDGPVSREMVAAQLARDAARAKQRWIWVYHAPPDRSPTSWYNGTYQGDAELTRWIGEYAPDIVLTGHIHESPFLKDGSWVDRIGPTWVFNAGRQIGPTPTHVIFDTERQQALWFSLAGAEVVNLDAPFSRPVEELRAIPDWLRT